MLGVVVAHGLGHGHAVPGVDPELRGAVGLKISNYYKNAKSKKQRINFYYCMDNISVRIRTHD